MSDHTEWGRIWRVVNMKGRSMNKVFGLVALGTAVMQTPAQMDAIFVAAAQYPAV